LALGLAIQEQGIAEYFVSKISNFEVNAYLLLLIFALASTLFSNFMSNTAATTILIPIAISLLALTPEFEPEVFPIVIGLCASCALLLPVSTPPNAIAFSTGMLKQADFRLGGIFIGLVGPIVIILWTLLLLFLF
jgi:solute carrier family 13 (sodium-dependent dicarboxylate transporter), member 2/3/5